MNSSHVKYVVVGGGGAGSAAADAIRKLDPTGSILLVGQEHSRPYVRPALSKEFLRREKSRLEIATDPVGWYAQKRIDMRTSRRVSHLDTARNAITLDNGEEIAFDKLLLATGASPKILKVPGADLPNVFYLRTLDDCDRLHHAIDKAKSEGRPHPAGRGKAAVIGSGLLAVEVASSLRQMDLHVDLVAAKSHPWEKFAGEAMGRFVTHKLQQRSIALHCGVSADRLEGDGRVQRVLLSDGQTLDCDFAVVAIGITPNRELLRGTPIAAEKAILVNDQCRTNLENIYAAGDCAAVFDPLFGKHRILDHWDSARLTGAIAGANMAAAQMRYDGVNSFFSDFLDITLRAWGDARFVDRRIVRGAPSVDSPQFAEIGVSSDGRVSQVLAIGRSQEHEAFRKMVAKRLNVLGNETVLNDPEKDIASLI
jgi:3-phenylpropionate/trans-cinnamate dioxygenase ferredoxin reductase subunit